MSGYEVARNEDLTVAETICLAWGEVGTCLVTTASQPGAERVVIGAARQGAGALAALASNGVDSFVTRTALEWFIGASAGTMKAEDVSVLRSCSGMEVGRALAIAHRHTYKVSRIQELRSDGDIGETGSLGSLLEAGMMLDEASRSDEPLLMAGYAIDALLKRMWSNYQGCLSHEEVYEAVCGTYGLLGGVDAHQQVGAS